ncbi:unnamed protein product [Effrenium voratum]|nr:unnamed protein product [Effrenium voratum]
MLLREAMPWPELPAKEGCKTGRCFDGCAVLRSKLRAAEGVRIAARPPARRALFFALPCAANAADLAEAGTDVGEGGYVKWGQEQQMFAFVFFVLFPFGTLYLIFSGRLGWWNYDESGRELNAEESTERSTSRRSPHGADSHGSWKVTTSRSEEGLV